MNRVVFGQFLPGDSVLHRLDPRTKLMGLLVYAVLLWGGRGWWSTGACAAFTAACVLAARPPLRALWRGLAPINALVALTLVADGLLAPAPAGAAVSWVFARAHGLAGGLAPAAHLWLLAWQSTLTTLTTDPYDLVDTAGRLCAPLARLGVPVSDGVLMATVALRFIPMLAEEAQRISQAQAARGVDGRGGLGRRWVALTALLSPLLVGILRRSDELALALEARGWGGARRTRWRATRWGAEDGWALSLIAALAACIALASLRAG